MADLFDSYWWLLFPLFFFVAAGWNSFMRYKRAQAKIDLLKTYAASGKEPPEALLRSLDRDRDDDGWDVSEGMNDDGLDSGSRRGPGRSGRGGSHAFLVILFAGLAAVFAYTGYSSWLGNMGEEAYFIAMIMGVLSLAFLVSAIFKGGRRG